MNTLSPALRSSRSSGELLHKSHAEYALLFGSYARGRSHCRFGYRCDRGGRCQLPAKGTSLLLGRLRQRRRTWMRFEIREVNTGTPFMKASCGRGSRSHEEIGQGRHD